MTVPENNVKGTVTIRTVAPTAICLRRGQLRVDCPQCGHQQAVDRAGRFRDSDFYEVWHERCELETLLETARSAYWQLEREWRKHYGAMERRALEAEIEVLTARCNDILADGVSLEAQLAAQADKEQGKE